MTIEEIKALIPHRYPFLLVDRVLSIEGDTITALKNVTANEEFFNGHFPGNPVMPGVLQVEALAQAACILAMKTRVDNPHDHLIFFSGISNCKFRKPVVPGDQLVLTVTLGEQKRQFATFTAKAAVDGAVTCEMEAVAAIVPKGKV
jgi:3-hydroxyacyl-[acyl-carrier-protein] dehydratase